MSKDRCLLNVAFTPKFIDTHVKLKHVAKGIIGEDLMSVKIQEIGFYNGNKIVWYYPTIRKDSIRITKYLYYDDSGRMCDVIKGKLYDKNHKEIKNLYFAFCANIDSWFEQMLKTIPSVMGNFDDIEDASAFPKTIDDRVVFRELDGWTLETENVIINIAKVLYEFDYQVTLEKIEHDRK